MSDDSPTGRDTPVSPVSGQSQPQDGDIPIDELHRLLASARRRTVVSYLAAHPRGAVPFDELLAIAVESEYPTTGPRTHRVRVTTDLHHVHLPKLDAAGVVTYDPVAGTVEYHESATLESLLAASEAADKRHEQP
ncbi:DUF7344 domain-containing protein [Halobacterium wangiae]|uniref:DUF7344 domain-containing protein n=1 Tax=Halobacterium wangiae TaxID=2902623 RepID=UPI001E64273D|nr:hypothetical protein [Halobacterium wangiae]